jgi:hypothetical protein
MARLMRRGDGWRIAVVAVLVASSVMANHEWSPSPIGRQYESGIWAQPQERHAAVNRALKLVKPSDGVTATYYLVPHLTHRVHIYEFPNPFVVTNWGINGEDPPNKNHTDVLVLDTTLNGDKEPLFEQLTAPGGKFKIVFDEDGIVVARRSRPRH